MSTINTTGGAVVDDANVGGNFIGRDQNNIFTTVINLSCNESQTIEHKIQVLRSEVTQYSLEISAQCDRDQIKGLEDRKKKTNDQIEGLENRKQLIDDNLAKWHMVDMPELEERYRQNLVKHYNSLRIFGTSSEVELHNVFTDVYIFAEPLSRVPYDIDALRTTMAKEVRLRFQQNVTRRVNGMQLVKEGRNLFILGKPGAGKTTFLKYLTVQAAQHKLERLPIFISLNEWANSRWGKDNDPQLLPFIVYQFELCHFSGAEVFVETLLRSGQALVLFDGLDEVRQEDEQRHKLTQLLKDFARQHDRSQHLITCRIAASDYAFPGFRDVEVADFSNEQVNEYAELWFRTVNKSHQTFLTELGKPENEGVRELCNSPLLLSMVCLYFERVMRFPPNLAELYEKAIEALLNKWDASRDIQRDKIPYGETIYRELSPRRKEQMFAAIAARTFEIGDYFFRRRDLEKWIDNYLHTLPDVDTSLEIDIRSVLRAIEAQHGIFVERAQNIYSFSHLTFQEYFVARYIFDNERRGTTTRLFREHLVDDRWREVFLLTASLFDPAGSENFFLDMQQAVKHLVSDHPLQGLLSWANRLTLAANASAKQQTAIRLAYIALARAIALDRTLTRSLLSERMIMVASERILALIRSLTLTFTRDLAFALARDLACASDLYTACDLAFNLAQTLSIKVGLDYGFYYAWGYAQLFANQLWPRNYREMTAGMAAYPRLVECVLKLAAQAEYPCGLGLAVPTIEASAQDWQQFANELFSIMQKRDLVHDWQFSEKHIRDLNDVIYANELLVQCLNVAVVSNRQAILNNLFAPPKVAQET